MIAAVSQKGERSFSISDSDDLRHFRYTDNIATGNGFDMYWKENLITQIPGYQFSFFSIL